MKFILALAATVFLNLSVLAQLPDSLRAIYTYDKTAPMQFDIDSSFQRQQAKVKAIRYSDSKGGLVTAYLVQPAVQKKAPVIVYQHWGEGKKDQYLPEAIEFAGKGVASLLVDAPWNLPNEKNKSFVRDGYGIMQQSAINIQRGIDLLSTLPSIDKDKILYVGHSFGAGTGAVLTALEPRIKGFVLMTGLPSATRGLRASTRSDIMEWKQKQPDAFEKWLQWTRPFDAELYIVHKKAPVFHQFATQDEHITQEDFKQFEQITPEPKKVEYYDAKHELNAKAKQDRMDWIMAMLQSMKKS